VSVHVNTVTATVLAVPLAEDGWDMHGWGDGWWVVMGLGMLLFWALVIVGIVWVVRELGGSRQERDRNDPLDILKRRLAQGEISVEEYERSRQTLEGAGRT
jgi:putative membrane protein